MLECIALFVVYSGGPRFKAGPGHQLSILMFSVAFYNP
jgi:hypothetical protein